MTNFAVRPYSSQNEAKRKGTNKIDGYIFLCLRTHAAKFGPWQWNEEIMQSFNPSIKYNGVNCYFLPDDDTANYF